MKTDSVESETPLSDTPDAQPEEEGPSQSANPPDEPGSASVTAATKNAESTESSSTDAKPISETKEIKAMTADSLPAPADSQIHTAPPSRPSIPVSTGVETSASLDESVGDAVGVLRRWRNDVFVSATALGNRYTSFAIDDQGTDHTRNQWLDTRVVGGFGLAVGSLRLDLAAEVLSGSIWGDTTDVGLRRGQDTFAQRRDQTYGASAFIPQQASLRWESPIGLWLLGHQSYGWGLGMLAQDGKTRPDFGIVRRNNLVERAAFATQPFSPLAESPSWLQNASVFLSADYIYRDDNASHEAGDRAYGGSLAFRIQEPLWTVGLFASLRFQKDRLDPAYPTGMETELQVTATDLYVSFPLWMDEEQPLLSAESEVALLVGETDRPYLEETLDEGAKILSMGWIGRLHLTPNDWLHLRLEAGYASGDNDGRDDTVSLFSFHSDYAAGMVLFDQVIPMLTARSIDRIHDPDLVETAPASTRYLVNQGAVRDVRYLYPVLTVQPWAWLECKAAYLYAQRASDVADPFQTGIAGGYSTGFDGTTRGSKDLGQEIAASIRITAELIDRWTASAQIEAGLFFPGAALSVLDQEKISALRLGGELSW